LLFDDLPKPIKRIFIDLDDTLVDYLGSLYDLMWGKSMLHVERDLVKFNQYLLDGGDSLMWKKLERVGPNWWFSLPKLPWADDLLSICYKICPDVAVLTSPGRSPKAAAGKLEWSFKHLGDNELILTKKKHMCASPGSVLIDDWDKFTVPWEQAGGFSIKLSREWSPQGYSAGEVISSLVKYHRETKRSRT
jgi:hypothetical protein